MMDRLKALRNPTESQEVRSIATAVAELERDLHAAVQDHYEALGAEPPDDLPPTEERVEQLCRLVEKQIAGDLWGYYVEEQADGLENTQKARKHAGKTPDEWADTWAGWVDVLRQQLDDVEDVDDRDLADRFCRRRFGIPLEEFEAAVVEWSPAATMRYAMRGRVDANIARIEQATEAVEAADIEEEPRP